MEKRPIVHVEISAADRVTSAKFYQTVFGWDYEDTPAYQYTTFAAGNLGGGFPDVDGQMYKTGDVVIYMGSDDLEADLKAVEAAGGKRASEPMPVPGMGSFAFFTDPAGNRLALWKPDPNAAGMG